MKIYLCVAIVLFSGLIGASIKNQFNKKIAYFNEIDMFLHFLLIKIAFFKDSMPIAINNFMSINKLKNANFFNELLCIFKTQSLNANQFKNILPNFITNEESQQLFNIFYSISICSLEEQNQLINNHIKANYLNIQKYKNLKINKGDIATKISICIGLVISILIY